MYDYSLKNNIKCGIETENELFSSQNEYLSYLEKNKVGVKDFNNSKISYHKIKMIFSKILNTLE